MLLRAWMPKLEPLEDPFHGKLQKVLGGLSLLREPRASAAMLSPVEGMVPRTWHVLPMEVEAAGTQGNSMHWKL